LNIYLDAMSFKPNIVIQRGCLIINVTHLYTCNW